jgi:hypothetical protein
MKKPRKDVVKPLMSRLAVRIVEHVRSLAMPVGAYLAEQALADVRPRLESQG